MKKGYFENRTSSFIAGLALLIICWSVFSLFIPKSSLPSLEADYSKDIKNLPDFSAFKNSQKKKQAFFNFLYPVVEKENSFLLRIRSQLVEMQKDLMNRTLNEEELNWISELSEEYSIEPTGPEEMISQLLLRIQTVPPSMVLAQAAIESGWGTSRFARKGNNLFGHWCFAKGCGLVPKSRDNDKSHEVAKFNSVNESIRAYLKNLNSFHRYEHFRKLRQMNMGQDMVDVKKLLPGLMAYSELGERYINKVGRMIRQNQLTQYDQQFYAQNNTF